MDPRRSLTHGPTTTRWPGRTPGKDTMTADRPTWLADGATAYELTTTYDGRGTVKPVTVVRATATQVIVSDQFGEIRYRLGDLKRVSQRHDGPRLAAPDDPKVLDILMQAATFKAMQPLTEVVQELLLHARLYTRDRAEALDHATRLRDAAAKAVEDLTAAGRTEDASPEES